MKLYFNSGFINFRDRKIGIVFSGDTAEHIMDNHIKTPTVHPVKHIRIQQLAKMVKEWDKKGLNIYEGKVNDAKSGYNLLIIASIHPTFAIIKTAYKY